MTQRRFLIWTVLALAAVASSAHAKMCSVDVVPAATLLLPYFEVDLDDPGSATTLISINNAEAAPALAHVIVWTDWAAPTVGFDVFLTGYDVVAIDLRDVFAGNLPVTADLQGDPADSVSPHGNPAWDASFPYCAGKLPFANPKIQGTALADLVASHTGQPLTAGVCRGGDHGDHVARGFVTIDSVSRCSSTLYPHFAGYFVTGGSGIANDHNVLWGDYSLLDDDQGTLVSGALVHVEAQPGFTSASTATGYTFYGRHLTAGGADNREPLGTSWAAGYGDAGGATTDFVAWRDPPGYLGSVLCGAGPAWYPLEQNQVVCFDETENAVELCSGAGCFPLATQRIASGDLAIPYAAGWCYLNLNHDGFALGIAQSTVSTIRRSAGAATGLPAAELAPACQSTDLLLDAP